MLDKNKLDFAKELFEEVLKINPSEREIFLNEKCSNDTEVKKEILSLIKTFETKEDFLEQPLTIDGNSLESFTDPYIGKQIGNYIIDAEAGVGGMGIVYAGKRNDKEFEQKVAIKILKQGVTSEYLLKRFQIERQTLANLQHPNIARLLDGGRTDEGLPYLVMEFINGIPITEYCNQNQLDINKRLELFHKVCSAVQYAHRNLVIHRDIKPGNILVKEAATPKLLDFGIAKLVDEDLNESAEGLTRTGMWHLTPEYSSPEQINGEKITTASDIYSLGVLLYEILTGEQPYKITSSSPVAISKIITEESILKPSEKVRQVFTTSNTRDKKYYYSQNLEKTFNQLKGDLDNIVIKAMHKDPEERYASVQDFMNDIDRFLNGLPVSARKDTLTYRTTKFIKRHKVGVTLFILFNVSIISSIIVIIYQGNIAAKERDRAQTELRKFEEVNDFILEMLSSADPGVEGKDIKVYDILDKAAKDVETELHNQPEVRAAIKQTLGSTFIGLGEYEKAKKLLMESLEENKKALGLYSEETAKTSHQLGLCYDWIGDYQLADSFYTFGINIYQKISEKPPVGLADNLNDFGTYLTNLGNYDSAATILQRSLAIYEEQNYVKSKKAAVTTINLAVNYHHQFKLGEAEKYYLLAQQNLEEIGESNTQEVASIYNNLAFLYMDQKKYEESDAAFQKSYEIKLAVLGSNHPYIGLALVNIGMLNFKKGNYMHAESSLNEAINFFKGINAPKDPILTLAYYWLGCVYLESDQLSKSEAELKNSLRIREEIFPENNFKIWSTRGELGVCYLKQKRYKDAEPLLVNSLNFFLNDKNKDNTKIERYLEYSVLLYEKLGDGKKAEFYKNELEKLPLESEDNI